MSKYKKLKKADIELRVKFGKKLITTRVKARKTTKEVEEKQLAPAFG
jgi:hypothetical protein